MSQYGKPGEQSMEEILASIRSSVDTEDPTLTAKDAATGRGNGSVQPPSPVAPASQSSAGSGNGRLQDALSQVVVGSPLGNAQGAATAPLTPSAPPPPAVTPVLKKGPSPSRVDDGLSDLFADDRAQDRTSAVPQSDVPPTTPTPNPEGPPSAQTFGTSTTRDPQSAPTPDGDVPLGATVAAGDGLPVPKTPVAKTEVKPSFSGLGSPQPVKGRIDALKPEPAGKTQSEVMASTLSPAKVEAVAQPVSAARDPKPKREPSFAALKSLASGTPPVTQDASKGAPETGKSPSDPSSSVLLPEMRDLKGSNPVAQMHSMVAPASKAKSGGFIPAVTPAPAEQGVSAADNPDEVPTEIISAPKSSAPSAAKPSHVEDKPGIAPEARVAASPGSRSLEDIVVDLLKPQLASWLEANMPRIVERALRAEQQRSLDKNKG